MPVIQLLINGEDFLLSRHLNGLLEKIVDPATRDFNFERVSAKELSGSELVDRFRTPPLMAAVRTVVVKDFDLVKKHDQDRVLTYLQNPSPQTNVILIAGKLDRRTEFYRKLSRLVAVIEFKAPYPNRVADFVWEQARQMDLRLEPAATGLIAEALGTDLRGIVSELEKLALYVWPKKDVTRQDVSALVAAGVVENIFAITHVIGERHFGRALALFRRMVDQGEPVIKIVALVVGHFRKLLLASAAGPGEDLAALLGIHPFFVKEYRAQLKRFTPGELAWVYRRLMDVSVGLRSDGASPQTLFETFLMDVCIGR